MSHLTMPPKTARLRSLSFLLSNLIKKYALKMTLSRQLLLQGQVPQLLHLAKRRRHRRVNPLTGGSHGRTS